MKKIIILSKNDRAAELYRRQIIDIFGEDELIIETAIIGRGMIPPDGNIYLVARGHIDSCMKFANETGSNFPSGIPIIDLTVEFRKKDIEPLAKLPKGTRCLLVNTTEVLAMECIADLHNNLGIYYLDMIPYCGQKRVPFELVDTAITIGEPQLVPDGIPHVIDLGMRWLSPEAMVELAMHLEMQPILEEEPFQQYRKQFAGNTVKVSELIAGSAYYKNIFHFMIECLDDGIIGINEQGRTFCVNAKAEEILGVKASRLIGKEADRLMELLNVEKNVNCHGLSNFLINYKGTSLNLTVNPILKNEKQRGMLIVIKRFYEQEQKQNRARLQLFERGYRAKYTFDDIIGSSQELTATCSLAEKMARTDSTVLITGETGTGKELLASAIHNASPRRAEAYIAINCSAMAESLLESELFGYDEGAFTGAKKSGKPGMFEYAQGGTIFLDEIEDMSSALQLKLLRVLQEKEIMHIGGDRIIKVDVRIIAATNQNMEKLVQEGKIRKDLYYRLNTLELELPPLRNRREDILPLFYHFVRDQKGWFRLDKSAENVLMAHDWDGNVRELENCVEYLNCLQKEIIFAEDLPKYVWSRHEIRQCDEHKRQGELRVPFQISRAEEWENAVKSEMETRTKGCVCESVKASASELQSIFQILYDCYQNQKHIGRKQLAEELKRHGVFLSEQQVRTVLGQLERNGFVFIAKGRGGTRLTPEGICFYEKKHLRGML